MPAASSDDRKVLLELEEAGKLYEEYLRLSAVVEKLPEEPTTTAAPVFDWDHPLGVVINQ